MHTQSHAYILYLSTDFYPGRPLFSLPSYYIPSSSICFWCLLLLHFFVYTVSVFSMFASFCHLPGFFMFRSLLTISLTPHFTSFYFYFPGLIWEDITLHTVLSLRVYIYQLGDCQVLLHLAWPSKHFRRRSLSWLCEGKLTPVFHVLYVHISYLLYHFITLRGVHL